MSSPFIAEIRIFPYTFAPKGWAYCNGQTMSIQQNTALFSLLGVTYGGNGQTTFGLPNLQGAFPIQSGQLPGGSNYNLGQTGGGASVVLTTAQIPSHTHSMNALSAAGNASASPVGNLPAPYGRRTEGLNFGSDAATTPLIGTALGNVGSSLPHNNLSPFLTLAYCIALQGVFPPRP